MTNYLSTFNENLNSFYSQVLQISNIINIGTNNNYGSIQFNYAGSGPSSYIFIGIIAVGNPGLCITGNNMVGIGTTNPQYALDVYGSTLISQTIYNGSQYVYYGTPINSYVNYTYTSYTQFYSGGGQTVPFVIFNSFSSTACVYLISAVVTTPGAGNNSAIITIFPGSPPSATITQLQALGPSFTDNTLSNAGFGYTTTSTTLTITTYNTGWWGFTQTYFFKMQLLSGNSF
jgi:hypothetical protein